eukprot:CAMPEP_0197631378 /NCGR_PEP_ID=MMETSP1338-20131121/8558_1 /TAXON_ID=43686 ORGANISM="Pelagodinium beii, Strain RCC1491" /NCGR_SAMPLE_ID=MMETSP1338 /ASSEMBLY_ACC=CAM_ASM_000754 /LENGTH=309 /DNA_ID=CAMNT_0043202803 /DNA_START=30 /DNA_END=959 /DNA_ORIENTATION=-
MGQADSSLRGCSVVCCTARERYGGELEAVTFLSPGDRKRSRKQLHDGSTGGTESGHRVRDEDQRCLYSYEDREERVGRAFLFNEKSMRPKMLMLKGLLEEEEALERLQGMLRRSFKTRHAPQQILHGASELCASEWAHRMINYDESMKALTEQSVEEAVASVLGSSTRGFTPAKFEAGYAEILKAVQTLTQERSTIVAEERKDLEQELQQLEDHIAACFSKMDEECTGSVTREHFVAFVCGQDESKHHGSSADVAAADAEDLFDKMSRGRRELTYEQFKDGITNGCLDILQGNIDLRRVLLKRYRDCWL